MRRCLADIMIAQRMHLYLHAHTQLFFSLKHPKHPPFAPPSRMKILDINTFQVVKAGMPCYIQTPFKLESIMQLMERNEKYIFWIQPPGTTVQKQIACVQINDVFYQLNLRLEKAIFRHIRLCKNFINEEKLADGTPKLRIPMRLLREKIRTSIRSKVCPNTQAPKHPISNFTSKTNTHCYHKNILQTLICI